MDRAVDFEVEDLVQFDIHPKIIQALQDNGIKFLRLMQTCAIQQGLFQGGSFFISSPSGSGKTLVGELSALYQIIHRHKKVLFLVPLRAIASEKANYFHQTYGHLNFKTILAVGDQDVRQKDLQEAHLLIMTYEKFDSYLRIKEEHPWITEIGGIVIDEVHILGEGRRGARLEALIIRLYNYLTQVQLILLSATVSNPEDLIEWINFLDLHHHQPKMQLIYSEKRPVRLRHSILNTKNKTDTAIKLARKIFQQGGQVLIFTNSRKNTELLAQELGDRMHLNAQLTEESIQQDAKLQEFMLDIPLESSLVERLQHGVGYHHAGLSNQERQLVEYVFEQKLISMICCTNTLSAGINTPTRAVILFEFKLYQVEQVEGATKGEKQVKYRKIPLDRNTFHQICGRAGRPGYDEEGFAYILAKSREEAYWVSEYYFQKQEGGNKPRYDKVLSSYLSNPEFLNELLLLKIYEQEIITVEELVDFARESFFWQISQGNNISMETYLNLTVFPYLTLLKLKTTPDLIIKSRKSSFKVELTELNETSFTAILYDTTKSASFTIKGAATKGLTCSCNGGFVRPQSTTNQNQQLFCVHEVILLEYLMEEYKSDDPHIFPVFRRVKQSQVPQSPGNLTSPLHDSQDPFQTASDLLSSSKLQIQDIYEFYSQINAIIHHAIFPKPLLEILVDQHFITLKFLQTEEQFEPISQIRCTPFGKVTLKCYMAPGTGNTLRKILLTKAPKTIPQILETILLLQETEDRRITPEFLSILDFWIDEMDVPSIQQAIYRQNQTIVYSSDIISIIEDSARIMKYIWQLTETFELEIVEMTEELYYRIQSGILPDLIPLAKAIKDVPASFLRQLFTNGYATPQSLGQELTKRLHHKTDIPLDVCTDILNKAVYYLQKHAPKGASEDKVPPI